MRKKEKVGFWKNFFLAYWVVVIFLLFSTGLQAQQATAEISEGSIVITPPSVENFVAMNVRIMAPDGVMVVDERSSGEAIEWGPGAGDPDGRYNYEAIVITYNPAADTGREDSNGEGISRLHGSLKVIDGAILVPVESLNQQPLSLWRSFGSGVVQLAQKIADIIVPSVYAADLTAEDSTPALYFDDTDDEDRTPLYDWLVRAEGGTSDSDTDNYFTISGYGEESGTNIVEIVRIEHDGDNSSTSPVNALTIHDNGDITLADGEFFFDKSGSMLGIGTNAPSRDLQINDTVPEIRLLTEGDSTYAHIQYYNGLLTFEGNSQQDIVNISGTAPADSQYIDSSGNIGFGTNSPAEAVDVYKAAAAARFQLTSVTDTANQAPQFVQRRARSGPAAVQSSDNLGLISFRGYHGTGYTGSRAMIIARAAQNWAGTNNGTELEFYTTPNNSSSPSSVLKLTQDGKVLVSGTELNVPDYVFAEGYDLMPLEELKSYIEEKKHLPNVADAQSVKTEGLDLTGTQLALLEKVEELTLYTLQQHEQLKEQQAEISKKDVSIKDLEKRLAMLEAAIGITSE